MKCEFGSGNMMRILILSKYLFFLIVFLGVTMWGKFVVLTSNFQEPPNTFSVVQNEDLQKTIKEKTGITVSEFYIAESPDTYGMMPGIPGNPTMILSRPLYESFSQDELEFVVLHEIGHYVHMDTPAETSVGIILASFGIFVLHKTKGRKKVILLCIGLGSLFGTMMLGLGKLNEYRADSYSIEQMTNPEGAISAAYKFKNAWNQPDKDNLIHILYYRRVPYYDRIKRAKEEIEKRKSETSSYRIDLIQFGLV